MHMLGEDASVWAYLALAHVHIVAGYIYVYMATKHTRMQYILEGVPFAEH